MHDTIEHKHTKNDDRGATMAKSHQDDAKKTGPIPAASAASSLAQEKRPDINKIYTQALQDLAAKDATKESKIKAITALQNLVKDYPNEKDNPIDKKNDETIIRILIELGHTFTNGKITPKDEFQAYCYYKKAYSLNPATLQRLSPTGTKIVETREAVITVLKNLQKNNITDEKEILKQLNAAAKINSDLSQAGASDENKKTILMYAADYGNKTAIDWVKKKKSFTSNADDPYLLDAKRYSAIDYAIMHEDPGYDDKDEKAKPFLTQRSATLALLDFSNEYWNYIYSNSSYMGSETKADFFWKHIVKTAIKHKNLYCIKSCISYLTDGKSHYVEDYNKRGINHELRRQQLFTMYLYANLYMDYKAIELLLTDESAQSYLLFNATTLQGNLADQNTRWFDVERNRSIIDQANLQFILKIINNELPVNLNLLVLHQKTFVEKQTSDLSLLTLTSDILTAFEKGKLTIERAIKLWQAFTSNEKIKHFKIANELTNLIIQDTLIKLQDQKADHSEIIKQRIQEGFDTVKFTDAILTALSEGKISEERAKMVFDEINNKANRDKKDEKSAIKPSIATIWNQETIYNKVVVESNMQITRFLFDNNYLPDSLNNLLLSAVGQNKVEVAKYLFSKQLRTDQQSVMPYLPLVVALHYGHYDLVKFFLQQGVTYKNKNTSALTQANLTGDSKNPFEYKGQKDTPVNKELVSSFIQAYDAIIGQRDKAFIQGKLDAIRFDNDKRDLLNLFVNEKNYVELCQLAGITPDAKTSRDNDKNTTAPVNMVAPEQLPSADAPPQAEVLSAESAPSVAISLEAGAAAPLADKKADLYQPIDDKSDEKINVRELYDVAMKQKQNKTQLNEAIATLKKIIEHLDTIPNHKDEKIHIDALLALGDAYKEGKGVNKNKEQAYHFYKQAYLINSLRVPEPIITLIKKQEALILAIQDLKQRNITDEKEITKKLDAAYAAGDSFSQNNHCNDENNKSPLSYTAEWGNPIALAWMIKKYNFSNMRTDFFTPDDKKQTPLDYAIMHAGSDTGLDVKDEKAKPYLKEREVLKLLVDFNMPEWKHIYYGDQYQFNTKVNEQMNTAFWNIVNTAIKTNNMYVIDACIQYLNSETPFNYIHDITDDYASMDKFKATTAKRAQMISQLFIAACEQLNFKLMGVLLNDTSIKKSLSLNSQPKEMTNAVNKAKTEFITNLINNKDLPIDLTLLNLFKDAALPGLITFPSDLISNTFKNGKLNRERTLELWKKLPADYTKLRDDLAAALTRDTLEKILDEKQNLPALTIKDDYIDSKVALAILIEEYNKHRRSKQFLFNLVGLSDKLRQGSSDEKWENQVNEDRFCYIRDDKLSKPEIENIYLNKNLRSNLLLLAASNNATQTGLSKILVTYKTYINSVAKDAKSSHDYYKKIFQLDEVFNFVGKEGNLPLAKFIIENNLWPENGCEHETTIPGSNIKKPVTLLVSAAGYDQIEVAKYLFTKDINAKQPSEEPYLPLIVAIHYGNFDLVKFFLQQGVTYKGKMGATALERACVLHSDEKNVFDETQLKGQKHDSYKDRTLHFLQAYDAIVTGSSAGYIKKMLNLIALDADKEALVNLFISQNNYAELCNLAGLTKDNKYIPDTVVPAPIAAAVNFPSAPSSEEGRAHPNIQPPSAPEPEFNQQEGSPSSTSPQSRNETTSSDETNSTLSQNTIPAQSSTNSNALFSPKIINVVVVNNEVDQQIQILKDLLSSTLDDPNISSNKIKCAMYVKMATAELQEISVKNSDRKAEIDTVISAFTERTTTLRPSN
jgi:ankyrin repeat protein